MTPNRTAAVKRIARRSYVSLSHTIVKLHSAKIIKSLGNSIKKEYKNVCSDQHKSIFRGDSENIKSFSWDKLWSEIHQHMPTLASLLTAITPSNNQPLVCTIISMLIKNRHQRMDYLQKVISAFLYANGAHKQVNIDTVLSNWTFYFTLDL